MWDNKVYRTYRKAKYILLTTNSTLAFACRKYLQEYNKNIKDGVFPCVTDVFLGTIIWLSAPVKKIESFSEKKLLADCMSMIQPSERLLKKLQDSIERARSNKEITDNQYYLLKYKAYQNDYLTVRTLNDENAFDDRITEYLLEDIENEIKAPLNENIRNLEAENIRMQKELSEVRQKEESEREQDARHLKAAEENCKKIADIIIGMFIVPLLGFIVNCIFLLSISRTAQIVVGVILGILIFFLPIIGWQLKLPNSKLHNWYIKRKILSLKIKELRYPSKDER